MSMTISVPLPDGNEESSLAEKIRALQAIDAELPAVVIVHSAVTNGVVYMSPRGLKELGVTLPELQAMGMEYYQVFFNPQDAAEYVPKIISLLSAPPQENRSVSFFQQVKLAGTQDWTWHLSSTRVFLRDRTGVPTHTITCAIPVEALHHVSSKVNRLLEENDFLRRNQQVFASLTKREKEILRLMALGFSAPEIAAQVHISRKTAVTHRRNIKAKIGAQSGYDLTNFAQAFDLI